ncbi:MAG: VOC family protein [Chloroflexota bacterium]|nr:VOC family protein [Dehalococcoidia bacterium]MDW8253403.1 VOC family protein [Chloroflexota bacterium]
MRHDVFGLGWFVRRSPEPAVLRHFYGEIIGLPTLREGEVSAYWAGETMALEIAPGGRIAPTYRDRAEAPCVPVFRVVSMNRIVERLKSAGVTFLNEPFERPHSVFAYFLDPAGNVTGLAERRRTSPRPEDIEAWRRWDSGRLTIPGVGALPPHLLPLGWVVLRCADVERVAQFFRDVVGLEVSHRTKDSVVFVAGEMTRIEIAPGGTPQPLPASHADVTDTFVLRVADADRCAAEFRSAGAQVVTPPFDVPHGRVAYFADPEGHLFGIQSRLPSSPRPEDREALARLERLRRSG